MNIERKEELEEGENINKYMEVPTRIEWLGGREDRRGRGKDWEEKGEEEKERKVRKIGEEIDQDRI